MQGSLVGQIIESIKGFATRADTQLGRGALNAFGENLKQGESPAGADILVGYLIENALVVAASGEAEALMAQGILPVGVFVHPQLKPDAIGRLAIKAPPLIVADDAHNGDLDEAMVKA